jgi:cell wall-associated NlpC family hydrolase
MSAFDPRVTPARADLAAEHLKGRVAAARYVVGAVREVVEPQAPVRVEPSHEAALATEALCGERVTVYETTEEGWAWGQLDADRYVGWMPANALAPPGPPPTHKVAALRTLLFPGPSIKLPPIAALPFGARIAVARSEDRFAITPSGAYLPAVHLVSLDAREADHVAVAERFLGTSYLWGGKTSLGLDCSGLVQVALTACGIPCPRDSDMQEQALGTRIAPAADYSNLARGDLMFWKGHVAVVRDPATLVHANAFHMATVIEPVGEAVARIATAGSPVMNVKRLIGS